MARVIDMTSVEEAIHAMRYLITKNKGGYTIMPTCAPGKDIKYNRFVMFTHKVRNDSTNEIVCYVTYRSKWPSKEVAPVFSSYEVFDTNYNSLQKFHLDYTDGTNGKSAFQQAYTFISGLLK